MIRSYRPSSCWAAFRIHPIPGECEVIGDGISGRVRMYDCAYHRSVRDEAKMPAEVLKTLSLVLLTVDARGMVNRGLVVILTRKIMY